MHLWNRAAFIGNGRAGAIKTAPTSNTTSIRNSTCQKIATAIVAISRRLINYRGRTRRVTSALKAAGLTAGLRHDEATGASTRVFELSTQS